MGKKSEIAIPKPGPIPYHVFQPSGALRVLEGPGSHSRVFFDWSEGVDY